MLRKLSIPTLVLALTLFAAAPVLAASPNFKPAIYADGKAWGTKGLATLPAPNGHNFQSFDKLFVITNSNNPEGQLPVSEAGPGNRAYNGGRWYTHTVMWTQAGFNAHGTVPVLKSYQEIMVHYEMGHLDIQAGSFEGGPPDFFECPLLPVK
jgi:hypothetical protein